MGLVLHVLASSLARLPWRAVDLLGAALGWFVGSVLRIRRPHVEEAMRTAGVDDVPGAARAMYRSLGIGVLELVRLGAANERATPHVRIDPASRARWTRALASGRGVVVAASHTGNWDLAACAIAREVELLVVTKRLTIRSLDLFWQKTRSAQGVHLVDPLDALARARAVLRRGGVVAMMIDQVPAAARHAIAVGFLGRTALVDRSPAALAASCGVPLVVAASRRDGSAAHVLSVLDVIEPPARPSRAWICDATRAATMALDGFVRAHPSQWLWLHRRWKRLDPRCDAGTIGSPCPPTPHPRRRRETRSSSPAARSRAA